MNKRDFFKKCWSFVNQQNRMVLVIFFEGECWAYVVQDMKPKGRDFFQNEVIGAQDITNIVQDMDFHSINNVHTIENKLMGLPLFDFTFGHDNFFWLKQQRKME